MASLPIDRPSRAAPITEFDVSVERLAETAIVRVSGELDIATTPTLRDVLEGLSGPCDRVILDLSSLRFMDSTGIRLAVTEHQRATADGFDFVIAGAEGNVMKILRLTGLDVVLPLAPDVASALPESSAD
jgi:anti-sigma B factor antagonist